MSALLTNTKPTTGYSVGPAKNISLKQQPNGISDGFLKLRSNQCPLKFIHKKFYISMFAARRNIKSDNKLYANSFFLQNAIFKNLYLLIFQFFFLIMTRYRLNNIKYVLKWPKKH